MMPYQTVDNFADIIATTTITGIQSMPYQTVKEICLLCVAWALLIFVPVAYGIGKMIGFNKGWKEACTKMEKSEGKRGAT